MVSSKDIEETKKICAGIRQMNKEVLDHLYAQAAETGHYLTPDKAIYQLYQLLQVVVIGNQPPMTLAEFQRSIMRKQDAIDLEAWLGSRLFRDTYHDAVDAYFRHRPGLEIKKGKRGPRPNVEQMEHVLTLHPSKSYRELAKEELQAEPEGEAKNLLIEKERERIRAVKRRGISRQSKA
jgi:hypothetical protein